MTPSTTEGQRAYAYEAVFCIFLAAIAFLGRDDAGWAYPQVLYLLVLLLSLNLAAGFALRRWPGRRAVPAAVILANCAVITAILEYSGGRDSLLWVLYLLPVFTAAMFLTAKELGWIAAGAVAFNMVFCAFSISSWGAAAALDLGLRSGILALAAVLTWRLAERERRALAEVQAQRREMDGLLEKSQARDAQDEATRRLAEVGLVTAGVLHDLKTPLTVILGFCEVGLAGRDPEAARADFERIRRAGLLCRDIVEQVLAAAGRRDRERAPCDVVQVLDAALALCEEALRSKRIVLRRPPAEGPLPVLGSFRQLQRLFLNLLTNAVQALPEGGTLTVAAVGPEPAAPGRRPRVQVVVSDDGPGLPSQALANLFKPFSTTKAEKGGTGLGLYICREIACEHQGVLQAENPPEGGARFTVTLPLLKPAPAELAGAFP